MRKITEIIVHCTATPEGRDVGVEEIRRCHVDNNGWTDIGYHYVVMLDGTVGHGRPEETAGAHCLGHNANSIGVAYVGGVAKDGKTPKDTRTAAQKTALANLLRELKSRYPDAVIHSHRDFAAKACPSFDATSEYRGLFSLVLLLLALSLTSCGAKKETVMEERSMTHAAERELVVAIRDSTMTAVSIEVDSVVFMGFKDSVPVRMTAYRPRADIRKTSAAVETRNDSRTMTESEHSVADKVEESTPATSWWAVHALIMCAVVVAVAKIFRQTA